MDRTLPATAYLEMARAALAQASATSDSAALELRDVHWARPVALRDAEPMHIALRERGGAVDFEVYSSQGEAEIVHCQGRGSFIRARAREDRHWRARNPDDPGQAGCRRDVCHARTPYIWRVDG